MRRFLSEKESGLEILAIHDGHDPSFLGVLVVVALLIGIFFHTVSRHIPVPFTVLMLALGLFLGQLQIWTHYGLGALSDSIENWQNLHPNTVLVVFLPALIFESAMNIDIHVFWKAFSQILLLAGPGVLINVMLVCAVVYYIFPYDWSFVQSITFGAMFSATDPVAVVALLRDLGAPVSLSTIIEGESLLNDGVAFVIFLFTVGVIKDEGGGAGDFLADFFYASGVGTAVGIALGYVTTFISSAVFDDHISQIMLTVVGTFGTFFIVEGVLQASGVLSIVAFGLCYAGFRHGGVSVRANEALGHIWEAMAFGANTVIFVYSGFLIIFYTHALRTESGVSEIEARDWGYLVLLYVLLNIIRAVSIVVLFPFLRACGYGMTPSWLLVMSWGGLRGAVGLTLGLILLTDQDVERNFAAKSMFFMSGIVAMTLLINAVSTGPLVRALGLNRTSAAAKTFYHRAVELIAEYVNDSITQLQRSTRYRGADWERVWDYIPVLSNAMKEVAEMQIGSKIEKDMSSTAVTTSAPTASPVDEVIDVALPRTTTTTTAAAHSLYEMISDASVTPEIVQDARIRFLNLVKSSYYRDFRNGAVTSKSYIGILIDSASSAQEAAMHPLGDWRHLEKHCQVPSWYSKIVCGYPAAYLRHFLVIYHISISFQLASAFVLAHESVVPLFKKLVPNRGVAERVIEESCVQVEEAAALLCEFEADFPDITRTIKTRQVSEQVLNNLISFAEELLENGEIEEKELTSISQGVHRSKAYMWLSNYKISEPQDRRNVFRHSELFIGMRAEDADEIVKRAKESVFNAGEYIQLGGKAVHGLYVVVHGIVSVQCGFRTFRLSYGDSINALSCCCSVRQNLTYCATTDVATYCITKSDVTALLTQHRDEQFERNLYYRAGVEAALIVDHHGAGLGALTANPWNIGPIMNKGEVIHAPNLTPSAEVGGVGILFSGRIVQIGDGKLSEPSQPITTFALDKPVVFDMDAIYLWIPPEVSWMLDLYNPLDAATSRTTVTTLSRRHSSTALDPTRPGPHGRSPRKPSILPK